MNNAYFRLYRQDVLALTRTLVIKYTGVAEAINRGLKEAGVEVDEADPATWKYYRHLAGEYHSTDTTMTVRSVDTLETITFSRENLRTHRATAREYELGTRLYNQLVRQYPDQVGLIQGILHPVDIDEAIAADDGTILYHDPSYVEGNETNLMTDLQQWVHTHLARWNNAQYEVTDDLYLPAFWGLLYSQLPSVILNLRLRYAKTPEAHSFHIREYLASNGGLDAFLPYLTKRQQLFLYRNIRYISRNVGKQGIFDLLTEHLLTARGLPLAEYRLLHNNAEQPEVVYPTVEFGKYPLNFAYNQTGIDRVDVHTILAKQAGIARDNASVETETEEALREAMASSAYSDLSTKVLESEVIDRTNASVRSRDSVLLNEWLYCATHGRYDVYINVTNPATGAQMNLSTRDAFIVALYAFSKARDIDYPTIPRVVAYDVLRDPLPSRDELLALAPRSHVAEGLVDAILDRLTPLSDYRSTEAFADAMEVLHREYLQLWELYSYQSHHVSRALVENLVRRCFMHIACPLVNETITFEAWLEAKGYALADLSALDLDTLYSEVVEVATGADLTSRTSLASIQQAMLDLMDRLTSYSVHFLRTISQDSFWYQGGPYIRPGDIRVDTWAGYQGPLSRITAIRHGALMARRYPVGRAVTSPPLQVTSHQHDRWCYNPSARMRLRNRCLGRFRVPLSAGVQAFTATIDRPDPPSDGQLSSYQLWSERPNIYPDTGEE